MTSRIALALTLTLATACVVAGEDESSLEEIEGRTAGLFTLYKGEKEVSYESLRRDEREIFDLTVETIDEEVHEADIDWTCHGGAWGWVCTADDYSWECWCRHVDDYGPVCRCDQPDPWP
ncbi:MAG TPA: hypothetical protein VFU21_25955 [Kofleriaceae bacterium]|nr:hypothetical protein [Kofleriaceae bacterium]